MAGLWAELGAEVKLSSLASTSGRFSFSQFQRTCSQGSFAPGALASPGGFTWPALQDAVFFLSIARSMGIEECDSQRALQFREVHEGAKL